MVYLSPDSMDDFTGICRRRGCRTGSSDRGLRRDAAGSACFTRYFLAMIQIAGERNPASAAGTKEHDPAHQECAHGVTVLPPVERPKPALNSQEPTFFQMEFSGLVVSLVIKGLSRR